MDAHVGCNGREAVEMCRTHVYTLVLLREIMAHVWGIEAASLIRDLPSPFNGTSIVMVTTKPIGQFSTTDLFLAGIDDVIEEPYSVKEMQALFVRGRPKPGFFSHC